MQLANSGSVSSMAAATVVPALMRPGLRAERATGVEAQTAGREATAESCRSALDARTDGRTWRFGLMPGIGPNSAAVKGPASSDLPTRPWARLVGAQTPASLPAAAGLLSACLLLSLATLMATPSLAQGACTASTEEDLRLVGGDIATEGSVQICHNSDWRHVCDDRWAKVDADVACKQLGYTRGAWRATIRSEFVALVAVEFWLDEVECTGSESKLADCTNDGWGVHNCQSSERAGVVCKAYRAAATE